MCVRYNKGCHSNNCISYPANPEKDLILRNLSVHDNFVTCKALVRSKLVARSLDATQSVLDRVDVDDINMSGDICGNGSNVFKDFDVISANSLNLTNGLTIGGDICGDGTNVLKDFRQIESTGDFDIRINS